MCKTFVVVDKNDHVTSAQVHRKQPKLCKAEPHARRNLVRTFATVVQKIHRKISFKSDLVNEIA